MKQLTIRKAGHEDKKDILKIIESYKPDHWDIKPANKHLTRFFESDDFPQDKIFAGMVGNKIVSVIGYCLDHDNKIGIYWLGWFYTHKDYNHRGIGRHMLEFVISELKAQKAKKLFVNTSSDEFYEPAVKFYLKMGFKKTYILKNYYAKGEHQIIMSKSLD